LHQDFCANRSAFILKIYEKEMNMSIQKLIARKTSHCCRFTQIPEADAPCVVGKCIVPI